MLNRSMRRSIFLGDILFWLPPLSLMRWPVLFFVYVFARIFTGTENVMNHAYFSTVGRLLFSSRRFLVKIQV
jgi:hypothetical protein